MTSQAKEFEMRKFVGAPLISIVFIVLFFGFHNDLMDGRPLYFKRFVQRYPRLKTPLENNVKCSLCHLPGKFRPYSDYGKTVKNYIGPYEITDTDAVDVILGRADNSEYRDGVTYGEIFRSSELPD